MGNEQTPMVVCDNLVKIYKTNDLEVVALQGLDLTINKGEMIAVIGKSGSGKSTLLNIIAGLDRPSAGTVLIDGENILNYDEKKLADYMSNDVGFVWQNNARNLIPYLTACANVELPMLLSGKKQRAERAKELLDRVGLKNKYYSKLQELSGGEQQRVAIAIALANNPKLLLADEPTGSVDNKTTFMIMELLNRINQDLGITMVIVTHDMKISKMVYRVVAISDGMISSEMIQKESYKERLEQLQLEDIHQSHEEYAVIDQKGRFRIPESYLSEMGLSGGDRIKIRKNPVGLEIYKE